MTIQFSFGGKDSFLVWLIDSQIEQFVANIIVVSVTVVSSSFPW